MITIKINGESRCINENLNIAELLKNLQIQAPSVAVELNRDILTKEAYGRQVLKEGDVLEIVHFVGGG